jgi:hypothetical protein
MRDWKFSPAMAQTSSSLQRWEPASQISKARPRPRLRVSFCFRTPSRNPISASQRFSFQLLLPVVLCFVFLYLAVAGGGRLSVDAMWKG